MDERDPSDLFLSDDPPPRRARPRWLDALVGTRLGGRMVGASLGPILELSDLEHPRLGASAGIWAFLGVTPFVRVGAVEGTESCREVVVCG